MTTVSLKKYHRYILYGTIIIIIMVISHLHAVTGREKRSRGLVPETAAHREPKPTKAPVCLIVAHL